MPTILPYRGKTPKIAEDAFVAPNAVIIGDVEIAAGAGVWFNVVLRGDVGSIRVGERSNIQDGTVVHLDAGFPAVIGDDVTIGHGAIIHGCVIESNAQVGMGAIILSRSRIGARSIVAAGALVTEGMEVPPDSLVMGVPGRVKREVTAAERQRVDETTARYAGRGAEYRAIIAEQ